VPAPGNVSEGGFPLPGRVLYLYHEMDVEYLVVDEMININVD
jgi:hypothetical protein